MPGSRQVSASPSSPVSAEYRRPGSQVQTAFHRRIPVQGLYWAEQDSPNSLRRILYKRLFAGESPFTNTLNRIRRRILSRSGFRRRIPGLNRIRHETPYERRFAGESPDSPLNGDSP